MGFLSSTSNSLVIRTSYEIEDIYDFIMEITRTGRWISINYFIVPFICTKQLLVTALHNIEEEHFLNQSTTVSIVNHNSIF